MKKRVEYLLGYLLFWLSYFIFFKVVFLIYHASSSTVLDGGTLSGIFLYGSRLDLAFTAYVSLIPFLIVAISGFFKANKWTGFMLKAYTSVLLVFLTILCTSDLELFRIWGSRLDSSPLMYLNTPVEMLASIGASPIWLLILLNILVNLFFNGAYTKLLHPLTTAFGKEKLYILPFYSLAGLLLIIPMRGGLQQIPINQSSAYFSQNLFANQAAINVPWNFFHSLRKNGIKKVNPYEYLPPQQADSLLKELLSPPEKKEERAQLLKKGKPNVVLIIWESFTAKAVEALDGIPEVTPAFNKLTEEGLFFTRMYASGDRSDKGLVALLSGRPAQPGVSLLKDPKKTLHIPHLSHSFRKAGYHSAFYYGGELAFANLGAYLHNGGFQKIIGKEHFKESDLNSKWGAHDHVVLERLLSDIDKDKNSQPFFKVLFTLSSHEPFDFPAEPRFKGEDMNAKFLSSLHYSDSTIGRFIAEAKKRPWYKNTLFIVVADHGHTYPGKSPVYDRRKFHIPMLWLGGALTAPPVQVRKTLSQTDLAATLLGQLGLPAEEFRWSQDIFHPHSRAFAHYFFKDGVGLVTDSSYMSFDNVGKQLIENEGNGGEKELPYAKAYLQQTYGDYLNK